MTMTTSKEIHEKWPRMVKQVRNNGRVQGMCKIHTGFLHTVRNKGKEVRSQQHLQSLPRRNNEMN